MSEWISVEDRLPPNAAWVLLYFLDNRKNKPFTYLHIGQRIHKLYYDDQNGDIYDPKYGIVTHWMPLPDHPIMEES